MSGNADLVRGWLLKAQSDLTALKASRRPGALDAACFHGQQAAEKFRKGFLTHHGADFPFTHNLAKLTKLCAKFDPAFLELLPVVEPLTPYAIELRWHEMKLLVLESEDVLRRVEVELERFLNQLAG